MKTPQVPALPGMTPLGITPHYNVLDNKVSKYNIRQAEAIAGNLATELAMRVLTEESISILRQKAKDIDALLEIALIQNREAK